MRPIRIFSPALGKLSTTVAAESYVSTATKHGIPQFPALVQLAEGRPWMPTTT